MAETARMWKARTGDPVLDWFGEVEEERLTKAFHPLLDDYAPHGRCKCYRVVIEARGELWEVTQTTPNPPWPCGECKAREKIWRWLAETGNRRVTVERLAPGVEVEAFRRIYLHLAKLVERYPKAVPEGGIRLTFDLSTILSDSPDGLSVSTVSTCARSGLVPLATCACARARWPDLSRSNRTPENVTRLNT